MTGNLFAVMGHIDFHRCLIDPSTRWQLIPLKDGWSVVPRKELGETAPRKAANRLTDDQLEAKVKRVQAAGRRATLNQLASEFAEKLKG